MNYQLANRSQASKNRMCYVNSEHTHTNTFWWVSVHREICRGYIKYAKTIQNESFLRFRIINTNFSFRSFYATYSPPGSCWSELKLNLSHIVSIISVLNTYHVIIQEPGVNFITTFLYILIIWPTFICPLCIHTFNLHLCFNACCWFNN